MAIEREIFRHLSRSGETAGIFNSQAEFSIATNQRDLSAALTLPSFSGNKPDKSGKINFRLIGFFGVNKTQEIVIESDDSIT